MFRALLLKEWLHHRWKLGFGLFMLVVGSAALLAARLAAVEEGIAVIALFGGLFLALFSAMGVFGADRGEGADTFLRALPAPPWQLFLAKWLVGWISAVAPPLACGALLVVAAAIDPFRQWRSMGREWMLLGGSLFLTSSFYHLTVCLAPRRAGEALTALTGLAVAAAAMIHAVALQFLFIHPNQEWSMMLLAWPNPIFFLAVTRRVPSAFWCVQASLFIAVAWAGYRKCRRTA